MRNLNNSHKILSLLLLGMFFISLLIMFDIANTPNPTQPQKFLNQDNIKLEQKSPNQDDILPKLSVSASLYNQTFNIAQSEDDAFGDNNYLAFPTTFYDTTNITLGVYDTNGLNVLLSSEIALRWNITVPKHALITKAYINLTVANLTSFGVQWTGFNTSIYAFNQSSTSDFSNPNEALGLSRPRIGDLPWELNSTEKINQTLQTINIGNLLQQIMDLDGWNGIFGVYILAETGTEDNETIQFWSYDFGNPEYYPKLFVEWSCPPYFTETPTDMTINNETLGYHINWTAEDNNPSHYYIIGNETLNESPKEVQSGAWQSGVNIRYDIPKIDIQDYDSVIVNYTLCIYDTDGLFECDSVLINVTDKGLQTITDIKFIQNDKEVDYFQPGGGDFSVRFYGSETALLPKITLSASLQDFQFQTWKWSPFATTEILVSFWMEEDTTNYFVYTNDTAVNLIYNSELGCWELTPILLQKYRWTLFVYIGLFVGGVVKYYYDIPVQDIMYNVNNKFLIEVNEPGNPEFISEGRVYGGEWGQCKYEVLNDDLTPPIFSEPEFIKPVESDKHYEININVASEEQGASVDEVWLYYSVDDGPWEETIMVLREGKYYGEIPPQPEDSEITYYIKIIDEAGNVAVTDEYTEKAAIFEISPLIVPILGIFLAILGSLSIVMIYRHKRKSAFKKARSEKIPKKSEESKKKGNKLLQKIKKVRKKQ